MGGQGGEHDRSENWVGRVAVLGVVLTVAIVAAGAYLLTSNRVPDPSEDDLVPRDWGADIGPDESNIAYGPDLGCPGTSSDEACGGSQELDVYLPLTEERRGTVVFFHGGGFQKGDKAPLDGLGNIKRQLDRGFGLVSANYRLTDTDAGENGFPDAVEDVVSVLEWVEREGPEYGLDNSVIITAGASAGGTLAGLAGTTANSDDPVFAEMPTVDGWISVSGIMTWEGGPQSEGWIGMWLGDRYPARRDTASVTEHIDGDDPPGYLTHGGSDTFVEPSNAAMAEEQVGILTELEIWRDLGTLTIDIVDDFEDGRPMTENIEHSPLGGANASVMDDWIDGVVERSTGAANT